MAQELYLKYRPIRLRDIVGNKNVVDSIESLLTRDDGPPHSFLFTGPSGCGKTTIARILKDRLGCKGSDFLELDAGQVGGVDAMRSLRENANYYALSGSIKVFILDEAHKLSGAAQNSLLKLLEDTPSHVYFMLCTTDPDKLLTTIKTRCHTYGMESLTTRQMASLLNTVLEKENCGLPERAVDEIVRGSNGSPRQALVILDSVIDIPDDEALMEAIVNYSVSEVTIKDLCKALMEKQKWERISKIIGALKDEPEKIRFSVSRYMETVVLNNPTPIAAIILDEFVSVNVMYSGRPGLTNVCYRIVVE